MAINRAAQREALAPKEVSVGFPISKSELEAYFDCPAKYQFMRRWQPLVVNQELQDGIDAHAILAGASGLPANPRAIKLAGALGDLEAGYTLADVGGQPWREQYQIVPWQGFAIRRMIDAGGWLKRTPVLIDYKTANWAWTPIEGIYPKALGFQPAMYLIPPPDPAPFKAWPERLDFLVAPSKGKSNIVAYERDEHDEANLLEAATIVAEAKAFPKVQGWKCERCPFFDVCLETDQWQKKYEPRQSRA